MRTWTQFSLICGLFVRLECRDKWGGNGVLYHKFEGGAGDRFEGEEALVADGRSFGNGLFATRRNGDEFPLFYALTELNRFLDFYKTNDGWFVVVDGSDWLFAGFGGPVRFDAGVG